MCRVAPGTHFGPIKLTPHLAIVMGRRDPQAVGVQVHVARGVGQASA